MARPRRYNAFQRNILKRCNGTVYKVISTLFNGDYSMEELKMLRLIYANRASHANSTTEKLNHKAIIKHINEIIDQMMENHEQEQMKHYDEAFVNENEVY